MMKWWKRLVKDHKGFSLVELICTIAIFSIIVTSVGTAMVVSARSYQSGNVELDLQQQAQITSNLLTNLIIDSDRVVQASGETLIVEKVESGVVVTYQIYYDEAADIIYYKTSADTTGTPRILAEHVTGFTVSQDTGSNVDFKLEFEENSRSYESDYHVTPRNGVTSGGAAMSGTASLFVENHLILEPGQEYDLNVRVLGTSIQGFTIENLSGCADTTGTTVQALDTSTVRINVGLGETNSEFHFDVKALDGSIAPQPVTVFVRRVNAINVSGYMVSGTAYKADAEYKVVATLSGTNLDREPGAWFDVDYVNPYTVDWSFDSGFEEINRGTDGNFPYIILKLKQDMVTGDSLEVRATALHPEGEYPVDSGNKTNKSGEKYGTVDGSWILNYPAWRRTGRLDIAPGLDDSYLYDDGTLMGNGEVHIKGYSYNGQLLDDYAMNYWNTTSSGGFVTADTGRGGDINYWWLVLNTDRVRGDTMAYSSPYFAYGGPGYGFWYDCAYYVIGVEYTITDGIHAGESYGPIYTTYLIEDVAIKYKNSDAANWNRINKVYVTTEDSINDYNVYFMFDKGWEGGNYYFEDVTRFVGIVHEDADDTKDVREDIDVTEHSDGYGNHYVTFSLPSDKKVECLNVSRDYGGIIKEIYEYNPYFGKCTWTAWDGAVNLSYPFGVTGADLAAIKGCDGAVEFHFVAPNISGNTATLKVKYCPTPSEFIALGNVYYVGGTDASGNDVKIKIVCNGNNATYQEESGATVNLTWNGSGWTAN